jgi:hypothetical protein
MATVTTGKKRGKRIQVFVDPPTDRRIRQWAAAEEMSVSTLIRRLVISALQDRAQQAA